MQVYQSGAAGDVPGDITKWRGHQSYQSEWVVGCQVVSLQELEAPFKR